MEHHNGRFPREYSQVLALSGIGDYTAGAVCSIAYDLPTPAVDGNVLRVIARLTNDATPIDQTAYKKQIAEGLRTVYPKNAGDFTQALMELGATVCGPNRKPDCENCPCKDFCKACCFNTAEKLPIKSPKRGRRQEDMTVFIFCCDGSYALEKRPQTGLLAGLWQFPNVPGKLNVKNAVAAVEEMGLKICNIERQMERKHIFTHVEWNMSGIYMEVKEQTSNYIWMPAEKIEAEAALPTAFRQFWEEREIV